MQEISMQGKIRKGNYTDLTVMLQLELLLHIYILNLLCKTVV